MEPELKNGVVELAPEPVLVRVLPLTADNFKGDILIRWACNEAEYLKVGLALAGCSRVRGCLGHID